MKEIRKVLNEFIFSTNPDNTACEHDKGSSLMVIVQLRTSTTYEKEL